MRPVRLRWSRCLPHGPIAGRPAALTFALALFFAAASGFAGDWPQFRGPSFDGSADEKGLPSSFGVSENVVWRTPLPGPGAGTPAVVGERIYLPSFDKVTGEVEAVCLDRATRQLLWRTPLARGGGSRDPGMEHFGTGPSPAARQGVACFMFGSGTLVAMDPSGSMHWKRELGQEVGPFEIGFGYASSPLLLEETVYVQVLQRGKAWVFAIGSANGKDRWKHERTTDAVAESQEAYTTPMPFTHRGRTLILVLGGDQLTAHDAKTGAVVWRWADYNPHKHENYRVVTTPLIHDDRVYVNAPQLAPLYALTLASGTPEVAWQLKDPVTDTPTPAWGGGSVVLLADRARRLASLDPAAGKTNWSTRLDLNVVRASPLVADGKVYVIDTDGEVRVLSLADGRVLGKASLGGAPCHASPVAADGHLYVRTADALWCFGTKR